MIIETMNLWPTLIVRQDYGDVLINREIVDRIKQPFLRERGKPFDLWAHDDACLKELRSKFEMLAEAWLNEAGHGNLNLEIGRGWVTTSEYGQSIPAHGHGRADLCGVYYADVGINANLPSGFLQPTHEGIKDGGDIVFLDPRGVVSLPGCKATKSITPKSGTMLIFPGYLWHSSTPTLTATPRVCVATNFEVK
jgi:hypothetical protein